MDAKRKLTKTIVIRITEDQYRKLLNSIKFIPSHSNNEVNNKSQVIREIMDKYLVPKLS
jgi:hypothetical protein